MPSIKSCFACALAFLSALVASNVRADSSAFLTFSGLEVALFDLDPGDGIDPAVALAQLERSGSVFQYRFADAGWPPLREDGVSGTGSAALDDANGLATVVLQDEGMSGRAVSTGGGAYTSLLADSFSFTLTPYTRVVFSTLTESAVTAETIQSALAVVTLAGQVGSQPGELVSFETSSVMSDSGTSAVPLAAETASAALPLSGSIALRGYAYTAGVSPVPEQGMLGLLLAGCTVLAAVGRRRRRPAGPQRRRARLRGGSGALPRLGRMAGVLALAIAGAALPGMAHASSGSASIYDFAYELFDLAPDDGIVPSLIFTSESVSGTVNANRDTFLGNPWDETQHLAGYGSAAITRQPGMAMVDIAPDALQVSTLAWRGAFAASGQYAYEFTLTPMTHVVFSAVAQLLVSHDVNRRPDASEANAGLSGEIASFPGQRTQFSSFVILNTPGATVRPLGVHAFTGNLAGTGSLRLAGGAFAVGVSPIPEPALGQMLLPGLVLCWAMAASLRKARQRGQAPATQA
ncbi:hypothetical protein ACFSQU_20675 [Massilia sp. GCM10020059]|uniref:PEP-CTERM protein-sorting domain-containing protein n=1 Tax=Massilia agrisoli TaxID=2892444 RepID=A0ABS8IVQ4_9BURK|nr:hypothetical protein [Massilia agrisoli]MCC6071951.1 hypothetical protein [Massilia agrisoli]